MNTVTLIGRAVAAPELKPIKGSDTMVTSFTLAVDNITSNANEKTSSFFSLVAFGKKAELLADYVKKGDKIGITGRLQQRKYETEKGGKREVVEIIVNEIDFLQPKVDK